MRIGGLQELSLCDFPGGTVSTVVFTQGCNFRCPFCHNGDLIPFEPVTGTMISEEEAFNFLAQRRRQLDGVVVSGGEPTLQPDLAAFIRRVKALGLKVKLDTNGSGPAVLRELLAQGLLDFVAMDLKAPVAGYNRLAGRAIDVPALFESMALISRSGLAHEFRTTVVEELLSHDDLRAIQALVPIGSPHRFQECRLEHALDPTLRDSHLRNTDWR